MMPDMPPEPQHARPRGASSVLAAAYAVLIWAGLSSVIFNIVHAFRHGGGNPVLPGLYGIGPAFVAVCLSHIAAEGRTGKILRAVVVLIMLASMAGSIGATASVAAPFAGKYLAWLYGVILDAGALAALRVILSDRTRKRAEQTAVEAAETAAAAARQQASEAAETVAGIEAELARVQAAAQEELDAARAELEKALARVPARKPRRSSARKPPRKTGASSAPEVQARSAPEGSPEADLDTEAQALLILGAEPGISGSQLGLRLGKSDRYGRDLIKRLAPANSGPDGESQ